MATWYFTRYFPTDIENTAMQHTISEGANPTPYKATGFGSVNCLYFILREEAEEAAVDGIDVKNAKISHFLQTLGCQTWQEASA